MSSLLNINKIDDDKLQLRYVLGIQEQMEDFPNRLDIMYIFILRAVQQPDRQKETFTKHALTAYHAKGHDDNIDIGLADAIKYGYIEQSCETKGKESYKIVLNPFI